MKHVTDAAYKAFKKNGGVLTKARFEEKAKALGVVVLSVKEWEKLKGVQQP